MKWSVSSLIQRGDTDGVMAVGEDVCLVIPFELWQYCATVHRGRGNCYRMVEV